MICKAFLRLGDGSVDGFQHFIFIGLVLWEADNTSAYDHA